jgi:signal transduction histidine kinase
MEKENTYLIKIQNLIIGKSADRFEEKLLLFSPLSFSIFFLISFVFNLLMKLKDSIVITSLIGFILFLVIFIIVRKIKRNNNVFFSVGLFMLLFIDIIWLVNYGSQGPVLQFILVFFSFIILLFQRKHHLIITVIILLNVIGLYVLESRLPDITGAYPDFQARLDDSYSGLILGILVSLSFLGIIKKNYIQEYERAKMSDRLKSSFLANMSHEIRTPLNAIVGFSSLVTEPDIAEDDKHLFMEQISSNSDYLLSLIEDIIDVSKIESNQLTLKIQDFDVVPHIRQVVQTFQLSMPQNKNVVVAANLDMSSLIIKIDPIRFEQILRNLLSNAVKFTEKGLIELSCKKDKDFYIFSVKDNGIGIPIEHQKIIFDRFMKIENNKQHLYRGTGIGLFLSRQLVEMFGGKIWVESEVGKGSTFYFTIPA